MSSDGSELNAQLPQQEDPSDSFAQLSLEDQGAVVKLQQASPLHQVNENDDFVPSHFCDNDSVKRDENKQDTSDAVLLPPFSDVEGNHRSNNSIDSATSPVEANHHLSVEIPVAGPSAQQQPMTTAENASPAPDVTGQDWTNPPISSSILKQRQKLRDKLHFLRTTLGTNSELSTNSRKQKNKRFHELYQIISILLMNGHFASFIEHRYESLVIASIDPDHPLKDAKDKWHVVIEDSIAFYLDVKGQFIFPKNLFLDETTTRKCSSRQRAKNVNMTIRSACFQGSSLIFSKEIAKCTDTKSIIYGVRCKKCPPESAAYNISYVGQTDKGKKNKRTAHKRHREHHKKSLNKKNLAMYQHAAQDPHTSDFHGTMEMIYLPMASTKTYYNCLNSWECFWQFFCRARKLRGGWCTRFPGDPINKESANNKKKLDEKDADESSGDEDEDESSDDQEEDEERANKKETKGLPVIKTEQKF